MTLKKTIIKGKNERIKISNIDDFKRALKIEGYKINEFDEEIFKEEIIKVFNVDKAVIDRIYSHGEEWDTTYRVDDSRDFIDYIKKIIVFRNEHKRLCEKIGKVKRLHIERIEYERIVTSQEDVNDIIITIQSIKDKISNRINEEEKIKIESLEKEIDEDYLYAKDIELLKKMLIASNEMVKENYNVESNTKRISIEIPKKISAEYIKSKKGSVEYHQQLNKIIPRIKRLIKNLDRYMEVDKEDNSIFKIDQSIALQDSINTAVAIFDGKEFKGISGSDEVDGYCTTPSMAEAAFQSNKVNKLGKLGIGYNRVYDSEKKILEEIHKQIVGNQLKNEGTLYLYSKWEPCPSCFYVIYQFIKKHPNIKVKVKYIKKYGE
ncbi:deaminase domain-containing protein [Clostridium paraputrificum]|uniref:deaminase domain-containing protein n=1 Tax=Clostridium TaxID=1485 RepID=UPI003D337A97